VSTSCNGSSQLSECVALGCWTVHSMRWSQILAENCIPVPHVHLMVDAPVRRSLSEYCHNVWYGKTRMVWLLDGEKMFIRFNGVHERDGWTDTALWHSLRSHSIARQKSVILSKLMATRSTFLALENSFKMSQHLSAYKRSGWCCSACRKRKEERSSEVSSFKGGCCLPSVLVSWNVCGNQSTPLQQLQF